MTVSAVALGLGQVILLASLWVRDPSGALWWGKALRAQGWRLWETTGWVREPCQGHGLTEVLNTEFLGQDPEGRLQEGLICCESLETSSCVITVYDKEVPHDLGLVVDDREGEPPSEEVPLRGR